MTNYAETIAYWYLRLNGFLLLSRFVLHRLPDIRERPTDCDMLGVRFPYVFEPVGGQLKDWDTFFVTRIFPLAPITGAIVEVKGGVEMIPGDAFEEAKLVDAVHRLGVFEEALVSPFVRELSPLPAKVSANGSVAIVKILFARDLRGQPTIKDGYHQIPLSHARNFIQQRLKDYPAKGSDWNFFADDLLQYLIIEPKLDAPA